MKETIKSMRLYFFLVGGFTVFIGASGMARSQTEGADLGAIIAGAVTALFGAAFFYAATSLKSAVEHARTKAIEVILYVNMAINVLVGLLSLAANAQRHIVGIQVIVTLVIGFYLLANLKRLVKVHSVPVAELLPTPPPPIPTTQSPPEGEAAGQEADGD